MAEEIVKHSSYLQGITHSFQNATPSMTSQDKIHHEARVKIAQRPQMLKSIQV